MDDPQLRRILMFGIVVVSVCIALVTYVGVTKEVPLSLREYQGYRTVREWPTLTQDNSVLGDPTASHTLVIFSDYQCLRCRDYDLFLRDLISRYPDQLKVVVRHNPLRAIHPFAERAAFAAECAARRDRFAPFHALLYENLDSLGTPQWGAWAASAGVLDTAAFTRCVDPGQSRRDVVADVVLAANLNLTRSPSVMLDGVLMGSTPTEMELLDAIGIVIPADAIE